MNVTFVFIFSTGNHATIDTRQIPSLAVSVTMDTNVALNLRFHSLIYVAFT